MGRSRRPAHREAGTANLAVKWWLCSVIVGLGVIQAGTPQTYLPPVTAVPVSERLSLVHLYAGSFNPFAKEYARLEKACGDPGQQWGQHAAAYLACVVKHAPKARYRVATLHAAPSASSPVVASIYEELQPDLEGRLTVTNLDRVSHPGERLPWPDAAFIGDYGLPIAGAQRRGEWVRLLSSIPVDGWLPVTPEDREVPGLAIQIHTHPLIHIVVEMSSVKAQGPDGRIREIKQGSFLIQRIDGAFIEFRDEIESDANCGEPVTDPSPLPPTLRAPITELFNPDGSARFHEKYTKGC